jgi:hypothetical protein
MNYETKVMLESICKHIKFDNIKNSNIIKDILFKIKKSNNKQLLTKILNSKKIGKFNKSNMFLVYSKYVPINIKRELLNNDFIINFKYNNIQINFFTNNQHIYCREYIEKILQLLSFFSHYVNVNREIIINMYLSSRMKKISNYIQGPSNINSGLTFKNEILIFRYEEWYKVLIHELIHCFKLDFSSLIIKNQEKKVKKVFKINSELNLFECYTEFWANIINTCFYVYNNTKSHNINKNMVHKINYCLKLETIQSILIMNNILLKQGLDYEDLFKNNNYKEDTNVFCYYVLKTIILYNKNIFLEWCEINNKNIIAFNKYKLDEFIKLIMEKSKDEKMLYDFDLLREILLEMYKSEIDYDLLNSTKMTLY